MVVEGREREREREEGRAVDEKGGEEGELEVSEGSMAVEREEREGRKGRDEVGLKRVISTLMI